MYKVHTSARVLTVECTIEKMYISFLSVILMPLMLMVTYLGCISRGDITDELPLYRDKVKAMFQFAYDSYLEHAFPYDELQPLTCDGTDTWGSYSLTLVDALDTLAIMGNHTEFHRVANLLVDHLSFEDDLNVSVFETNIRVVGGLLSSHLLSQRAGMDVPTGWPCQGPLLEMAETVARKLLPAFDTPTGMPYGTVNLLHGVPKGETAVSCTAGIGTFIVEFGTLSRLTGDPIFEEKALRALDSLWGFKSEVGMVGNHVNVQTGKWTALDSGIGAGVDSYLEYLVKGSLLLGNQELMDMFKEYEKVIYQYSKKDDWYMWVNMMKGQVTMPVFQSLDAYWPGLQSLIGKIDSGMKTLHNYHQVWRQLGFLPEFYNIVNSKAVDKREGYPLRPEFVESAMYLYQATKDPFLLQMGRDVLTSIETTKTECGYTSVKDVKTHRLDNRMESFFLAETLKYLYLLFDPDNFIHQDGGHAQIVTTPHGKCFLGSGGYIFNTEAHPIDVGALACCSSAADEYSRIERAMRTLSRRKDQLKWIQNYIGTDSREGGRHLSQKGLNSAVNCSAQPFHAKMSILGEMFPDID